MAVENKSLVHLFIVDVCSFVEDHPGEMPNYDGYSVGLASVPKKLWIRNTGYVRTAHDDFVILNLIYGRLARDDVV